MSGLNYDNSPELRQDGLRYGVLTKKPSGDAPLHSGYSKMQTYENSPQLHQQRGWHTEAAIEAGTDFVEIDLNTGARSDAEAEAPEVHRDTDAAGAPIMSYKNSPQMTGENRYRELPPDQETSKSWELAKKLEADGE